MRHLYRVFLLLSALLVLAACGKADVVPTAISIPTAQPTATSAPTFTPQAVTNETLEQARPAKVRIVNAAADSPALNVFAGFSAIATNLAFTQFTEPTSFDAGKYTIKIQASGSAPNDKPLLENELTFASGESIMVLITGSSAQLTLNVLSEENEALKSEESAIRVINGLSDNNAVGLKNGTTDLTKGVGTGRTVFTPALPTGKADLTFQLGNQTLPYTATLKGQTITTLIVVGTAAKASVVQFDSPASKRISVRAINASTEITKIDVYLDDQLLNDELDYGRPSERKNIASGQYTVRVYSAGADRNTVQPLTGQVVSLIDADNYAIVLLGSASKLSVLAFAEDLSPTPNDRTRIAFLDTLPNLSDIQVEATAAAIPDIPQLFFGQAPAVLDIQAGKYSFMMGAPTSENRRTTIEKADNIQFEAGYSYLYLVTGRLDSPPLILSDKVNTTGTSADLSAQPASQAANVRFINAVDGQTLDFAINGAAALTGLKYGEGSALVSVSDQNATISINSTGQNSPLGQQDTTFEAGSRYTVVAYNTGDAVGMFVINDDNLIFDGSSPHIRLINASANEDSSLGLAFSAANDKPNPTIEPAVATPEVTPDVNQPSEIFTLPYGVQKLISNLGPSSTSSIILMPTDVFNLDVIESNTNRLVFTLPKVSLDAGIHVDVVAYQLPNSDAFMAFAVIYPKPQA